MLFKEGDYVLVKNTGIVGTIREQHPFHGEMYYCVGFSDGQCMTYTSKELEPVSLPGAKQTKRKRIRFNFKL